MAESRVEITDATPSYSPRAPPRGSNGWRVYLTAKDNIQPGDMVYQDEAFISFQVGEESRRNQLTSSDMERLRAVLQSRLQAAADHESFLFESLPGVDELTKDVAAAAIDPALSAFSGGISDDKVFKAWRNSISLASYGLENILSTSGIYRRKYAFRSVDVSDGDFNFSLFLSIGLMPHSCAPNTVISISPENGGVATAYAIRTIRRGEPITRSWLPDLYTIEDIRHNLFRAIFRDPERPWCLCRVCERNKTDVSMKNYDDLMRAKASVERSRLDNFLRSNGSDGHIGFDELYNLIRLLEYSHQHSYCDVLALRTLYLDLAQMTARVRGFEDSLPLVRTAANYTVLTLGIKSYEASRLTKLLRKHEGFVQLPYEDLPIYRFNALNARKTMERLCTFGIFNFDNVRAVFRPRNSRSHAPPPRVLPEISELSELPVSYADNHLLPPLESTPSIKHIRVEDRGLEFDPHDWDGQKFIATMQATRHNAKRPLKTSDKNKDDSNPPRLNPPLASLDDDASTDSVGAFFPPPFHTMASMLELESFGDLPLGNAPLLLEQQQQQKFVVSSSSWQIKYIEPMRRDLSLVRRRPASSSLRPQSSSISRRGSFLKGSQGGSGSGSRTSSANPNRGSLSLMPLGGSGSGSGLGPSSRASRSDGTRQSFSGSPLLANRASSAAKRVQRRTLTGLPPSRGVSATAARSDASASPFPFSDDNTSSPNRSRVGSALGRPKRDLLALASTTTATSNIDTGIDHGTSSLDAVSDVAAESTGPQSNVASPLLGDHALDNFTAKAEV